jgi:hypothetical protein
MPRKTDVDNMEWDDSEKPIVKVSQGYREMDKRDGNGFSKKGVWTSKTTGEKYKRNYPAPDFMVEGKDGSFKLNPDAFTVLNRGSKSNKAIDINYKGNVKGDRMLAKLMALKTAKSKKGSK